MAKKILKKEPKNTLKNNLKKPPEIRFSFQVSIFFILNVNLLVNSLPVGEL